ncbi:MAG: LUD domain-containing protein, partial [Microgenomates group bacterium]
MDDWTTLATDDQLQKTSEALTKNGFKVIIVATAVEAKQKVLDLLPPGVEVQANTSVTLDTLGLLSEIDEGGKYQSVRGKTMALDRATQGKQIRILRSIPDYSIGSAHAVTENGEIVMASNTGSQIPSYAYGAEKVILIIGTHKLVTDIPTGIKRIYEHCLPLESERATKAYGTDGSSVNKMLILAKEPVQDRTTIVLVKEVLGF